MPVTATRRNGIGSVQSTVARNTALEKQKKLQDASRNNTVRNIAVGVITVGAIAAAAYLGRGYIFGNASLPTCPADAAAKACEQKFISQYKGTAAGSQFSYDYSKHLKSVDFKKCIAQQNIV